MTITHKAARAGLHAWIQSLMGSSSPRSSTPICRTFRVVESAAMLLMMLLDNNTTIVVQKCSWEHQVLRGLEHRLKKVSLKGVARQEFHGYVRIANEGAQVPAQLAAQQQVARQPGKQNAGGNPGTAAQLTQQGRQLHIRH